MDIVKIQSLIAQGRVVSSTDIDPTQTFVQIGVYQPENRKIGSANNTYPSFVIPLSELTSGGTWGTITGVLAAQLDLQAALDAKENSLGFVPYDATNPDGFIDATALAPYQLALGFTPEDVANKDIDGTLSANSNTLYSSQRAVKTYVDASVVGVLDDRGNWDASSGSFPSTGGSGPGGSILKGDLWFVSVPGTLGGTAVVVGNNFRALVDNPVLSTDWNILNVGLGYIPENIANKGIANGYAGLDATGKVPASQLSYKTIYTHGFSNVTFGLPGSTRWYPFGMIGFGINSQPTDPGAFFIQRMTLITKTGTITGAKINWFINSGGSTQNTILTFRNRTTGLISTITTTLAIGPNFGGTQKTLAITGLNIPVTENDQAQSVIQYPPLIGTQLSGVTMIIDYIIE